MAIVKKRVGIFIPGSPEEQFVKVLTPYALDFILKQLAFQKVVIVEDKKTHSIVSSSTGNLSIAINNCQCTFCKTMHLPCR